MADDPWARHRQAPAASAPTAPAAAPGPAADPWASFRASPTAAAPAANAPATLATPAAPAAATAQPGDFWTRWAGLAPASQLDPDWKPTGNSFLDS